MEPTQNSSNTSQHNNHKLILVLVSLVLLAIVGVSVTLLTMNRSPEVTINDSNGANVSLVATNCQPNAQLVNPCRPWIGAASAGYGVGNWKAHILHLEKRAGRQLDVIHTYHSPTQTSVNADELSFINRPNTLLYMNWKPDLYWKQAGGGNATVNGRIDKMADSIKSLGSKKIFLTIYHEPENDLSRGGSKCSRSVGNKGTTTEYKDMWKNVRKRFDAKGVKNVVWVMNYMGWSGWDCAVKDLWPGNNLVDWVTWDQYTHDKVSFKDDIGRFYNFLTKNTDATHDFTSKPWGIGEMGYEGFDQQKAYKYYDDMLATIKNKTYPNLKMYLFFDLNGKDFGGDPAWDSRIGYSRSGKTDAVEQRHFNSLLSQILSLTSTETTTPVIRITQPKSGTGVSGKVTISGAVGTTSTKIKIVTLRVDGKWVATDYTAPYSFTLDTTKFSNSSHKVTLRTLDANGNRTESAPITLYVRN